MFINLPFVLSILTTNSKDQKNTIDNVKQLMKSEKQVPFYF